VKRAINVFLLSLGIGFIACTDSNVKAVKGGILEFDKSLTIGQAFDNFQSFKKNVKWEPLTTENGKKVVKVRGNIAADDVTIMTRRADALAKLDMSNAAEIQFEFTINADKTIDLGWCGVSVKKKDGTKIEPMSSSNTYICRKSLKAIYENSPEIPVLYNVIMGLE
jgi:hypothetical protein